MTLTDLQYNIGIVLPTRGRTTMLFNSLKSLVDKAYNPQKLEILLGFDNDDVDSINYYKETILPYMLKLNIRMGMKLYNRKGYARLNEYINDLAFYTNSKWIMFWGDDAIMETTHWDTEIMKYQDQFKLLSVITHNEHPYSIFPILPRSWYNITNDISKHQLSDKWISDIAYYLGVFQRIPVYVTHDRYDLTGNNNDATYNDRPYFEGNHNDPRDINHIDYINLRMTDADKLAWFMKEKGLDINHWNGVRNGTISPWTELKKNDPNNQVGINP